MIDKLKITLLLLIIFAELSTGVASVRIMAGGAGSSGPVYRQWWQLFQNGKGDSAMIEYKYLGSTKGKLWIKNQLEELKHITPVFVSSDTPLTDEDYKRYKSLKLFPVISSAVVVVFNIPNVTKLVLGVHQLAEIFSGQIKHWDDNKIKYYNPLVYLPHREIIPIVRREGAGATHVLTTGFSIFNDQWKNGPGIFSKPKLIDGENGEGPSLTWPANGPKCFGWRISGVAAMVKGIPYSLSYLGIGEAIDWGLNIVTLLNQAAYQIPPSKIAAGTQEAMEYFSGSIDKEHLTATLINAPTEGAYPIPNLSYFIVNSTTSPGVTCEQMKIFVRLASCAINDPVAVAAVREKHLVPISSKVAKLAEENVLNKITCKGRNVKEMIAEEDAPSFFTTTNVIILLSTGLMLTIVLVGGSILMYRYIKRRGNVKINSHESLLILKAMKDLQQENLNQFIGLCLNVSPPAIACVWKFCSRRNIESVVFNDEINLDMIFKMSLIKDIIKGLMYLHSSPIGVHGQLTVSSCLIDSHWSVKLTQFGLQKVLKEFWDQKILAEEQQSQEVLLTMAPEILTQSQGHSIANCERTKQADIYSLGMVIYQILFRLSPFHHCNNSGQEILEKLKNSSENLKPKVPNETADVDGQILQLMTACWKKESELRPGLKIIQSAVFSATSDQSKNIVEHIMEKMEKYTENLEKMVETRTQKLEEERHRADELLGRMLPRSIAEKLKNGQDVYPETYDSVTIFFSDIVGFTSICSLSSPMEVVTMLNQVYSMFDKNINSVDAYKGKGLCDTYWLLKAGETLVEEDIEEILCS